jgi:hypothetical protein
MLDGKSPTAAAGFLKGQREKVEKRNVMFCLENPKFFLLVGCGYGLLILGLY